jgi:hypothetical protein
VACAFQSIVDGETKTVFSYPFGYQYIDAHGVESSEFRIQNLSVLGRWPGVKNRYTEPLLFQVVGLFLWLVGDPESRARSVV